MVVATTSTSVVAVAGTVVNGVGAVTVVVTVVLGVGTVVVDFVKPQHEQALAYFAVPEQGFAYLGTFVGQTVTAVAEVVAA